MLYIWQEQSHHAALQVTHTPCTFSSWFPGWSLGFSGKLLEKLSLSFCSLSPSWFMTHLSPCFRHLLILNFLIWKVCFWGFGGRYFMVYQINKSCTTQMFDPSRLPSNPWFFTFSWYSFPGSLLLIIVSVTYCLIQI